MELTGMKFTRLTVIERTNNHGRDAVWICRCECGIVKPIQQRVLRAGTTKSCGCFNSDLRRDSNTKHGQSRTSLYRIWVMMRGRCEKPSDASYANYGGRGITVCERWMKFENFLADMGERPQGMSIDRIDNDGNYKPGNCRWATRKEQNRNTRRNVILELNGKSMNLSGWAELFGVHPTSIGHALRRGRSFEAWAQRRGHI